jgi:hypothetical protein
MPLRILSSGPHERNAGPDADLLLEEDAMTETPKETARRPTQAGRTVPRLDAGSVPIHLTASPDLVDLALAYVADGSIFDPATPALLRRIASEHLAADEACAAPIERPVPPCPPISDGFVLVDSEILPGVHRYRLAKVPANVSWRIRIGAFERRVHRTLLVLARRLVRSLAAAMASLRRVRARAARLLARPRRPGWAGISDELPAAQR